MKPIFIAGPHGSGKTTLISALTEGKKEFIKDDFEFDFSSEIESLPVMTIFEKCLLRLYHRFYTAELAIKKCSETDREGILIVDRSIYDSLVYIEVEYKLGELTDSQYQRLRNIVDNSLEMIRPYTVILNPEVDEVVNRLMIRRESGSRKLRDKLCEREDNTDYVGLMSDEFVKLYSNERVLHISNNEKADIEIINKWLDEFVQK